MDIKWGGEHPKSENASQSFSGQSIQRLCLMDPDENKLSDILADYSIRAANMARAIVSLGLLLERALVE
jgi:hypothetical protein